MSSSLTSGDDAGAAFCASVDDAFRHGTPEAVSDESLQRVLSAAVRLYAAKAEDRAHELAPFGDKPVNATEAVTAICAIMRAADLNFFDLQMWYRRGDRRTDARGMDPRYGSVSFDRNDRRTIYARARPVEMEVEHQSRSVHLPPCGGGGLGRGSLLLREMSPPTTTPTPNPCPQGPTRGRGAHRSVRQLPCIEPIRTRSSGTKRRTVRKTSDGVKR